MKNTIVLSVVCLFQATAITVRADEWQRLAEQIPYINYWDILYNRPPRNIIEGDLPRLNAIQAAMAIPADLPELKKRVEHADPKIRALALLKLFVSGDPNAFRVIHTRLGDEGLAFPSHYSLDSGMTFDVVLKKFTPPKIDTQEQKVGELALRMMGWIDCPRDEDFEAWAKQYLDNPDWMGWYEFLLNRITQQTRPVPQGIEAELAAFEKLLDQRPPALRAWLGFIVADESMTGSMEPTVLGTGEKLIEKGKELGPDALLGFLKDGTRAGLKPPNVDKSKKGIRFILRHAKHFFRTKDAEALREMGHYIAAADLRPEMASLWIREASAKWSDTFQEEDLPEAMAVLLTLCGDKETKFVVDWLYATNRTRFITEYHKRRPADWKKSMTALVAHPGFDAMHTMSLIDLALMINDLNGEILVDKELLTNEHETELRNTIRRSLGLAEKPLKWIDLDDQGDALASEWTVPFDSIATQMTVSADGEFLAIITSDGQIRIHKARDGAFLGEIPADDKEVATLEFCRRDGRLIVVRATEKVEFWNPQPLRLEREVKIEGLEATEDCLDRGGKWLATRRAGNVGITVYDLQTGKRQWNMPMPIRAGGLIGASPDGLRFAVCDGFNRKVLLIDPAKAKPLALLDGHSGMPEQVAFSENGETVVTSGEDSKILVWNAKTGERIAEFASRMRNSRVQACSGDSSSFFFAGAAGKITRVDLKNGRVIQSLKFDGSWLHTMARSTKNVVAVVHTANDKSTLVGWRLKDE